MPDISTKPYMLRAIYEWCTDSGFTPYLAVKVDSTTTVPMAYVKKGEIVLNISFGATSGLKMDNDAVRFNARFGGVSREIYVPVHNVLAIYAQENGQGMAFEVSGTAADNAAVPVIERAPIAAAPALSSVPSAAADKPAAALSQFPNDHNDPPKKGGRPTLTVIK